MWAMHSLRESAGVYDQIGLASVMELYLQIDNLP
jgi:aspartyl aminopeptidase